MTAATFEVGQVYFGTLSCAHGDFPVRVTKRTAKTVWFEHATMPQHYEAKRSRVRLVNNYRGGYEAANFHGWYMGADKRTGGDFDTMTI